MGGRMMSGSGFAKKSAKSKCQAESLESPRDFWEYLVWFFWGAPPYFNGLNFPEVFSGDRFNDESLFCHKFLGSSHGFLRANVAFNHERSRLDFSPKLSIG